MSGTSLLPLFHRTTPTCRLKEKYLIVCVLVIIILGSFGTVVYMPEVREAQVLRVYDHLKNAGPELLAPPSLKRGNIAGFDRLKLQAKIAEDDSLRVLQKPDLFDAEKRLQVRSVSTNGTPLTIVVRGGEDRISQDARQKRDTVKQMMKHAWSGYEKYAWGYNELRPISKKGHTQSVFGSALLGASIVDAMDTLYIMGLEDEFNKGREWIEKELTMDKFTTYVSVFEVNIRYVGGLLTCYALTGDDLFKNKAKEIALKLLPAFDTPTGIPLSLVNFEDGQAQNYRWSSTASILSEYGSLYLEFYYLSEITGDPIFKQKVDHILDYLHDKDKPKGLYPNYINPYNGNWGTNHVSIGSLGDSFYEYLLKIYLQSNKLNTRARNMFEGSMSAMLSQMLFTSPGGLVHFSELRNGKPEHKMEHLACFAGGMLGLAAHTLDNQLVSKYKETARDITRTCRESYDKTRTKLGPESFRFSDILEAQAERSGEIVYIQRPEVLESYFYMWRLTKEQKYRDWGWDVVQALEKYAKIPTGGYTGLKNVNSVDSEKDDVMQSFFLAETLKYLYLLFSDDDLISLDQWVYNTEAHPLPIKDVNPLYRAFNFTRL